MKFNTLKLLIVTACGLLSSGYADVIQWAGSQGTLGKAFDDSTDSFTVSTSTNAVTFQLEHNSTSSGMDSASQWSINRWPPPPSFTEGNFNVVTNANNDIVLGLYGFYGENGFTASTPPNEITIPVEGDTVSYTLSIGFEAPVSTLSFDMNGINALTKTTGFNSQDFMLVEAFLGTSAAGSPQYSNEGPGFVRQGDELIGDWFNRIGLDNPEPYDLADQHVTDEGSVTLTFTDPVDRVDLTMTNVAKNEVGPFSPGFDEPATPDTEERLQTWAYSVGDLTFTTIPEPSTTLLAGLSLFLLGFRRRRR